MSQANSAIASRPSETNRTERTGSSNVKRFLRSLFSRRIVIVGAAGTLFFVLIGVFAPLIATHDPNAIDAGAQMVGSSAAHWLGTDFYGRDLFSRLVYGTRVSLLTGVIATLMATAIGSFLGMSAAFYGGILDKILMRGCDAFNAIPQIAISMSPVSYTHLGARSAYHPEPSFGNAAEGL